MKSFEAAMLGLRRMEAAGFEVTATGGTLRVAPANKLNDLQRDWIRQHKQELLAVAALPDVRRLVDLFDATITSVQWESKR